MTAEESRDYGIVDEDEVLTVLRSRPEGLDIVITGRDVSQGLMEQADLVTEMRELKHPFTKGVKARKGIEF